jgi:hypothetical protein
VNYWNDDVVYSVNGRRFRYIDEGGDFNPRWLGAFNLLKKDNEMTNKIKIPGYAGEYRELQKTKYHLCFEKVENPMPQINPGDRITISGKSGNRTGIVSFCEYEKVWYTDSVCGFGYDEISMVCNISRPSNKGSYYEMETIWSKS